MATKKKKKKKTHSKSVATSHRSHSPRRYHGRRRRRSGGGGTGVKLSHALIAGAVIGYSVENVPEVAALASKIPGSKTFGVPATIGAVCLGVDKFVHRNKWLKIIGMGGLLVGAYQLGQKKFAVQWVGDPDYALADVGDPDDGMISDVDD